MKAPVKFDNEMASAGGLAGIFILFVVCSLFVGLLSPIVDEMNHANNGMISVAGLPVSQDRVNTIFFLTSGFAIVNFMILIGGGINYWINSIKDQDSNV
jgi:hypothetical protein